LPPYNDNIVFHGLYSKLTRFFASHERPAHTITFDSTGFTVHDGDKSDTPVATLRWSDVQKVELFKRDILVVDRICAAFYTTEATVFELNEEMAGWSDLTDALPVYLPGCESDWFKGVAFPAFETNLTEIYRRTQ
jgi:hypothetical protein